MAVRDWSPRRLMLVWTVGLLAEAALLAPAATEAWRAERAAERRIAEQRAAARAPASPEELALRDSILRLLSERHGITIHVSGDTVTDVQLSPEVERAVTRTVSGLGPAIRSVMLLVAALYLPIPIGLTLVTVVWLRTRRTPRLELPAPAS